MTEASHKVHKVVERLSQELGRLPKPAEIARRAKVSTKKVDDVLQMVQQPIALQTPIGDDDHTLGDLLKDQTIISPLKWVESLQVRDSVALILHTLTPREEEVIRMRFGIGMDREHTLAEVGDHLCVTRERIRQIEVKALGKLRRSSSLKTLQEWRSDEE